MKNVFHFYNANPAGKRTTDCVIRAISTATDQTWEETFNGLAQLSLQTHYMIDDPVLYNKYLRSIGWEKQKQPRHQDNTRIRAREFVETHKKTYIAHLGHNHIACIKDGQVWDTWDSSGEIVGNYWTKVR